MVRDGGGSLARRATETAPPGTGRCGDGPRKTRENRRTRGHRNCRSENAWLRGVRRSSWRHRLAQELSGGWKQKLALANAILHRPKILFLDEPTAGIDPISRRSLWELLYQIADGGVALFVTTHYMEEAERCNQIAFISRGKLLKSGSPEELKKSLPGKLLEVHCQPVMKGSRVFGSIPGVLRLTAYGTSVHLNVTDTEAVRQEVLRLAQTEKITISSIETIDPSLEDVFATIAESERE